MILYDDEVRSVAQERKLRERYVEGLQAGTTITICLVAIVVITLSIVGQPVLDCLSAFSSLRR